MRGFLRRLSSLVILAFLSLCAHPTSAQVSTTLHSFIASDYVAHPAAGLVLFDGTLYGTVSTETYVYGGMAFAVNTDGTGYKTFLTSRVPGMYLNSDGVYSFSKFVRSGQTLYGTAENGGAYPGQSLNYSGTVFAIDTDGTNLRAVHVFEIAAGGVNNEGAGPRAGLVLSSNTLYGTTARGGSGGNGGIFKVNTDGSGFTNLHNFTPGQITNRSTYNTDGAFPQATMVLSGSTLFGTTRGGGTSGLGTLFLLKTDGTGFISLHSFTGGSDGAVPVGELALKGDTLYGTTTYGGSSSNGTVFTIKTDGSGFATLHSFSAYAGTGQLTSEGYNPQAGLTLRDTVLYGTTASGGTWDGGTVFTMNMDGSGFKTLYSFDGVYGINPYSELVFSDNRLYGTTYFGGTVGSGVVFSLALLPQLTAGSSGRNLTLSWPTNAVGFDYTGYILESTTNVLTSWTPVSAVRSILNGNITVTLPSTETQEFFRLRVPPSTVVKLLQPRDAAALQAGDLHLLASAAADPFDSIASVTFLSSNKVIGVATNAPYSFFWSNVPPGAYALQAIAENTSGVRSTSLVATVTASVFLQNGGFETGDFTGWAMVGTSNSPSVTYNGVLPPSSQYSITHSGSYGCVLGDIKPAYLSQTLWTAPGQLYELSFWLDNLDAGTNQFFNLSWNSQGATNQLLNIVTPSAFAWTNYHFVVTGSGSDTTILIEAENDTSYFGLDDITLTPIP